MAEAAVVTHQLVQRPLAAVSKGRVPDVMGQGQGLAEGLVQKEGAADAAGNLGNLKAVREACAVVVTFPVDEDLGLVHQTPEGGGMDDAVAVALPHRA